MVEQYLNPLLNGEFGQGVVRSQLAGELMENVRGAQNVTFPLCQRTGIPVPSDDIEFIDQEVVDYAGSTIIINIIGGS